MNEIADNIAAMKHTEAVAQQDLTIYMSQLASYSNHSLLTILLECITVNIWRARDAFNYSDATVKKTYLAMPISRISCIATVL